MFHSIIINILNLKLIDSNLSKEFYCVLSTEISRSNQKQVELIWNQPCRNRRSGSAVLSYRVSMSTSLLNVASSSPFALGPRRCTYVRQKLLTFCMYRVLRCSIEAFKIHENGPVDGTASTLVIDWSYWIPNTLPLSR